MRAEDIDATLDSGDLVRVCRTLRYLGGARSGPHYPQARVLALLGPDHHDRIRENALKVILRKGQHPLEDRRVLDLLSTAPRPLFRTLIHHVAALAFPSAAEDTLSWCWEKRLHVEGRQAILSAVRGLGGRVTKRFIQRHHILSLPNSVLVSAALALLSRVQAPDTEPLFQQALRHENPRFRSTALEYLAPRWSPPTRLETLRSMRKDPHHRVRSTAAVLSHDEDAAGAIEVLVDMAKDTAPLARAAAAWGLGELAGRETRCRSVLLALEHDSDLRVASRARASLEALRAA